MINKDIKRDGFLFGDHNGPWSTEHLTKAMTRETAKRIGFRMTTQEYRHIAIAIDRKFIRGKYADLDDDEEDDDDIHDEMAAHSTKVAICKGRRGRKTEGESSTGTAQGGTDVKRNSERMQDQQEEEEQD